MKLTNTSAGDRGVYVAGELVMVRSGDTVDGVDAAEAESVKDWFAPVEGEEAAATDYDDLTDDQLRDMIEEKTGKRPHHKTGRAKLLEALA